MRSLFRRPELDKFWDDTQEHALSGICDASCELHQGSVEVVRILNENADWGWFSYCQAAREEDQRRGYRTMSHDEWLKHLETHP